METTKPTSFVFVLMPFTPEFDDIYQLGIKSACEGAGAYCERVDEQIFDGSILHRIYNQISKADIIVSDMTGKNPNVFYETGYAHALGKRVILLTKDADDIPFDLKHYPHIVYQGKITELRSDLEKKIAWWMANPEKKTQSSSGQLQFFIEGTVIENNPTIYVNEISEGLRNYCASINLSVFNFGTTSVDASGIELGIIAPIGFKECLSHPVSILPNKQCLIGLGKLGIIPPEFWKSIQLNFTTNNGEQLIPANKNINLTLKIFTEIGTSEREFTLNVSDGMSG